jgi:hypothetical protein
MAKRLKHLSHRLIPFFIAGLTVLITVTASSFSLLHPQTVNAQQVSRGDGKVEIQLPRTGSQNDDWSCGPNSAARIIRFYGFNATYDDLRTNRLGTAPHELRNAMSRWAGEEVKLERESSFERLLSLVSQGKPVITLVRVGSFKAESFGGIGTGTWPLMHWFVVRGFDQNKREIYIHDTNESEYSLSYDDFMSKWSWGIGRGAASSTLDANGVKTRTMVWIDRTPASLASSPAPSTMRVTICNRIPSTATFFLNSELKSMQGGKCGGYTLPAGSQFKTSYGKDGRRIQVLVNLEGGTYDLVKYPSGDIELKRK